jgi:hypothetical protein
MNDQRSTAQRVDRLRPQRPVRVGDDADVLRSDLPGRLHL